MSTDSISIEWNRETIKAVAAENKCSAKTLIALTTENDPFFVGAPAQVEWAKWFAGVWQQFGYGSGTHIRRVHYQLVSQETPVIMPNDKPYENSAACWDRLVMMSKWARYLNLVEVDDFVDRRAPEPMIFRPDPEEVEITLESDSVYLGLFPLPDAPSYKLETEHPAEQRYHLEVWCEKSTMNDVLIPLCEEYGCNLITGVGEMSVTAVRQLMHRFVDGHPARIFYISDFDPAGESMPVAVARKTEYYLRKEQPEYDVKLFPVVLSHEQTIEYKLQRTPIKETEARAVGWEGRYGEGATELDALEALHPGELRKIVKGWLDIYYDDEYVDAMEEHNSDVRNSLAEQADEALEDHRDELDQLKADYDKIAEEVAEPLKRIQDRLGEIYEEVAEGLERNGPDTGELVMSPLRQTSRYMP